MRRLKHHQRIEIHLEAGDEDKVVPCVVLGVEGSVASLASLETGEVALFGRSVPAMPGYLVFDHNGGRVALKGIATPDNGNQAELLFVVIDGVQLPERRSADRVQVDAVARLFASGPDDDREYVETPLADLSISGMRVARRLGLTEEGRYRLELYIGDQPAPICCDVEVARGTPTHLGMRFIDLQETDQALLRAVVASRRNRDAGRDATTGIAPA